MGKRKKDKLIILSIILLLISSIGGVYAWLTFTTSNIIVAGNTHCFNINYSKGNDIIGNIGAINEEDYLTGNTIMLSTTMGFSPVSIELDKKCNKVSGIGTIELNVNSLSNTYTSNGNSYGSLKYVVAEFDPTLYEDSTIQYLKNQTFNYIRRGIISEEDTIDIHTEYLEPGDKHNYLVIIYLDKDKVGDDIIGANITATVSARADQFVATPISDFTYATGSYNGIQLPENTILLSKYNGTDTVVNVPSTYTVNDTIYNTMVFSDLSNLLNATTTFNDNINITEVNFADGVLFYSYDGSNLSNNSANMLFKGCTGLVNAPKLPDTVEYMMETFKGCTSLTNIEYVPRSVTNMDSTFEGCTNLEGYIRIVGEEVGVNNMFEGTIKNIVVEVPANSNTYTDLDETVPNNVEVVPLGKLDLSTPYTDFIYILGSDQTEITQLSSTFCDSNYDPCQLTELDDIVLNGTITIDSDEILLVRYIGENPVVTIPETYNVGGNTYRVKLLSYVSSGGKGRYATGVFYGNDSIQEVYLNENIGSIAFDWGSRDYVDNSFAGLFVFCNSLTTVPVIPHTAVSIADIFWQCTSLTGNIRVYDCSSDSIIIDALHAFSDIENEVIFEIPSDSESAQYLSEINDNLAQQYGNVSVTTFESDYCSAP